MELGGTIQKLLHSVRQLMQRISQIIRIIQLPGVQLPEGVADSGGKGGFQFKIGHISGDFHIFRDIKIFPIQVQIFPQARQSQTNYRCAVSIVINSPVGYFDIVKDLDDAIRLFEAADQPSEDYPDGVNRVTMSESANIVKTYASAAVAYGLRARANLFRCEYAAAASDAQKAIDLARVEGIEPYSRTDIAVPAFTDLNDKSFMWGMYADESQSEYRGVVNWASHMTGWQTNGYAAAGVYRCINSSLYGSIEAGDVRKGWWLDGSAKAPASLPGNYATYITSGVTAAGNSPFPAYAQLKFGSVGGAPTASGAIPTPLMRVEEMYLILAEAQGRSTGVATGMKTLADFVKTYRNTTDYPYTETNLTDPNMFIDEVWRQRRIELWGEGFAYYDLMRLQKGLDRRQGGFPASVVFNLSADNTCLLFDIPQSEIQRNPLIVNGTNNSVIPQPVEDN